MDTLKISDVFEPYYAGKPGGFAGKVKPESVISAMKAVDRVRLRHGSHRKHAADTAAHGADRDTSR